MYILLKALPVIFATSTINGRLGRSSSESPHLAHTLTTHLGGVGDSLILGQCYEI